MYVRSSIAAALVVLACTATAQTAAPKPPAPAPPPLKQSIESAPDWPRAAAADVDSPDHIIAALYDVISGPSTKLRDWTRFRSLFLPDGRLRVIRPDTPAKDGKPAKPADVILITPQMYIDRDDPYFREHGFFEHSIANRIESFGNLTTVWSTYESRNNADDAKPFERGINAIQLAHAAGRFWIVNILWGQERDGLTLPDKYLK